MEYAFDRRGKDKDSFSDRVKVTVVQVRPDGSRDLDFDFLSGGRHLDFHSATAYRGNPISIQFLERDIAELSKTTGGDAAYFRNRLRRAFAHPEVRPIAIEYQGQSVEGIAVVLTPFADDPNRDRFPEYVQKRYELQLPGAHPRRPVPNPNHEFRGPTTAHRCSRKK